MGPKLPSIEVAARRERSHQRSGERDVPDSAVAEQDDGVVDRGHAAIQPIERRVHDLEDRGHHGRVAPYDLGDLFARNPGVVREGHDLRNHVGKRRKVVNAIDVSLDPVLRSEIGTFDVRRRHTHPLLRGAQKTGGSARPFLGETSRERVSLENSR